MLMTLKIKESPALADCEASVNISFGYYDEHFFRHDDIWGASRGTEWRQKERLKSIWVLKLSLAQTLRGDPEMVSTAQHYTLEPFQIKVIRTNLLSADFQFIDALPLSLDVSLIQEDLSIYQIWSNPPKVKNSSHRHTCRVFEIHAELLLPHPARSLRKHPDSTFSRLFRYLPRFTSFPQQPINSSSHSVKISLRKELYSVSGITHCPKKFLQLQSIKSHIQHHPNLIQGRENDEELLPPYIDNQSEAYFQGL